MVWETEDGTFCEGCIDMKAQVTCISCGQALQRWQTTVVRTAESLAFLCDPCFDKAEHAGECFPCSACNAHYLGASLRREVYHMSSGRVDTWCAFSAEEDVLKCVRCGLLTSLHPDRRCPRCGSETISPKDFYCDRCGTLTPSGKAREVCGRAVCSRCFATGAEREARRIARLSGRKLIKG